MTTLETIKANVCYTPLVFQRFNKKLNLNLTNDEIKKFVQNILNDSVTSYFKKGKNYYVVNKNKSISLTINSHNYRLITANKY